MKTSLARNFRVRCGYCGKVVRSNGKGELIYLRDKCATDEVKLHMKLYEVKSDSGKVISLVGFTCPYCGTNILANIDMNKAKYK